MDEKPTIQDEGDMQNEGTMTLTMQGKGTLSKGTLSKEEVIQKVRFEIINLAEQYTLFNRYRKRRYSLFALSIFVAIMGIVMANLLTAARGANTVELEHIGPILTGLFGASTLVGTIMTISTYNYSERGNLNSSPELSEKTFKPMFINIPDDILEKMGKYITYGEKEEEKLIIYYINFLKRKNEVLLL